MPIPIFPILWTCAGDHEHDTVSEIARNRQACRPASTNCATTTGVIRPHWRAFAKMLTGLSPEEYARRRASAGAMVRDNGVTYNVYDESAGQARPWQLDIVPFILSAADWNDDRSGGDPARPAGRPDPARCLWRAEADRRRPSAAASGPGPSAIPAAAVRRQAGAAMCMCICIPPIWRARPTAPGG